MGVATSLFQRWWGRTTAAITLAALLAVVMAVTGIVGHGEPDATAPVGAPAGPPPEPADEPEPEPLADAAPAPEPAPAVADPVVAVLRAPVARAARYPGALLDAPDAALGAYQRAAAIINTTADCHLDWLTLAAIARIESNHGRGDDGAHTVDEDGVVTPALVGLPLNGKGGRGQVDDTDAGELDGNRRWDAPVGPFGLLPATWALVAVDADGDDVRDPQDVDDASLAAAVVLCVGGRDLADADTLRKALTSYHRTRGFAATVLALTELYAEEMRSVPVFMSAPGVLPIPEDLAAICDCARESKPVVRLRPSSAQAPPAGPGSPDGKATPPPGTNIDPGPAGDPVDPPGDPVDPPAEPDPVEPQPSTEPESPPAPVDPPAEPDPDPSADRVATVEPAPEPAPAPEPEPEPTPAPEPEPAPDPEPEPEPEAEVEPTAEG